MDTLATFEPKNLRTKNGDMFTTSLPAFAHGCNTHGVMGAGVAKIVRARYSDAFYPYKSACGNGTFVVGSMLPVFASGMWVLNLATQDKPGPHANLEWIRTSLELAAEFCEAEGIAGFAMPRIGAGIGGLDWQDVYEVVVEVATAHPDVIIEIWSL